MASDYVELAALDSQGLLSAEEFNAAKQRIINEKPRQQKAEPPALKPTPVLSDGENKRGTWGLDLSIKDMGTDAKTPVPAKSPVGYWMAAMSKDFLNFEGRASRAEFWWTALINDVIIFVSSAISPEVALLFAFISLIPSLALEVRRMHDTNNRVFLLFLPVANLALLCRHGDKGQNRFGPSPK